jgi:hypothetical protein
MQARPTSLDQPFAGSRCRGVSLALLILLLGGQTAMAAPPFSGTIFIDPDIITSSDPTTFVSAPYAGQGSRTMFDRRVNAFVVLNAYLFNATFSDGRSAEIQVNPEFGSQAAAQTEASKYGAVIGRLPGGLRADVQTVWIHKGVNPFGGGNNNLLIHTGQADDYVASGILEEALVHEASHTSLDATHAAASAWISAQNADGEFISTYARDNRTSEDVAESYLPYMAVRYRSDRISQALAATIQQTIPNRIAYFDAHPINLFPITGSAPTLAINDAVISEGNAGTKSLTFTVTLTSPNASTVTVSYATGDGTDTYPANAGSDYTSVSGTLTFTPPATSQTLNVSITGDTRFEPDETFVVNLSGATNATIADNQGKGTISNDDNRAQPVYDSFFAVDTLETPYVGDFNGDGRTDIITFTRQNPNSVGDVYVSPSNGTSFAAVASKWHDFFAITTDETVVIGDFTGDGKDDIATWLGKGSRQVYVAPSLGTGMAAATVWVNSIGSSPTDYLAAGDANGDGKDDLILFARTEGKVYVALSNGTQFGVPSVWHPFFAVSTYERPRVADVNGDGKADIVTFATDSPTAFGDVYTALSNGTAFRAANGSPNSDKWHDFFAVSPTEEVRVGHVDSDSKDDFFTFLPHPFGQCYTVRSLGNAMTDNVLWPEEIAPLKTDRPFVGDVNGDGKDDIVVFAQSEGKVYVSLGQ